MIIVVAAFPGLAPQKHKTGLPCNKAEAVFLPLLVPDSISDVHQLQICGVVDWCYDCVYQPLGQVEVKQPHVFISRVHVFTALTAVVSGGQNEHGPYPYEVVIQPCCC